MLWGLAYALPFYIPPGAFAMTAGGKTAAALYTNLFDAAGFTVSNPKPNPNPNPNPNPSPNPDPDPNPNPNQAGFTVSAIWNPWASASNPNPNLKP